MNKIPTSRLPVTPKTTTNTKSGLRPPQQTSPAGEDPSKNLLAIGDRVITNGKLGTIAFMGSTKFAEGMISMK